MRVTAERWMHGRTHSSLGDGVRLHLKETNKQKTGITDRPLWKQYTKFTVPDSKNRKIEGCLREEIETF